MISRRVFILAAGGAPLVAADFWEKKKFPDWSEEEIRQMLGDSPWAKPLAASIRVDKPPDRGPVTWKDLGIPGSGDTPTVPGGSPVGGIGAPPKKKQVHADITIRWASALPVKQAQMIRKYGSEAQSSFEARRILEREESHYTIEVIGLPTIVAYKGANMLAYELKQSSTLTPRGKKPIAPGYVEIPPFGAYLSITFRFPRTEPIALADKEVEFISDAGMVKLKKKFDLKAMVYEGRLEL